MLALRSLTLLATRQTITPFIRSLGTTQSLWRNSDRHRDRRDLVRGLPAKEEGIIGAQEILDVGAESQVCYRLPDENTMNEIFDGQVFSEIPILHIWCSKNNTQMFLREPDNKLLLVRSCGREGFKNCRKGTTVAAETTGLSMATKMQKQLGIRTVRVCIRGMGPGRAAGLKGLVAGGANVISITDSTPYLDRPPRPRAAKSI